MNLFKRLFTTETESAAPRLDKGEVLSVDPYDLFATGKGAIERYNPDDLISRKGLDVYTKMRNDDQVKSAMKFKKHLVASQGWTIESPEGKPEDWEVAKFVEEALHRLDGTLERTITGILSGLDYGYSVSEKVYEQGDIGKFKNVFYLKKIKTAKPHEIYFTTDTFGNLVSVKQNTKDLPLDKLIIYSHDFEFGNYYGNSDLRAAYEHWWVKSNAMKWLAMLLERHGVPPVFAMYDPGAYQGSERVKLQNILKNMQAATVAMVPRADKDSIEFWSPDLADNVNNVFIPAMDMLNKNISRALLMPGLLGMTPDGQAGSYARAQTHFDVFMLMIESIQKDIEEFVMKENIIKQLVDLNFTTDEYPIFKFLPISDDLKIELFRVWNDLLKGKVVTAQYDDEKHIRAAFDFPELKMTEEEWNAQPEPTPPPMPMPPVPGQPTPPQDNQGDGQVSPAGDNAPPQPEAASDDGAQAPKNEFAVKLTREKTRYEKKVDFAAIASKTSKIEVEMLDDLRTEIKLTTDKMLAKVSKGDFESGLQTTIESRLSNILRTRMVEAMNVGMDETFAAIDKKDFRAKAGYIDTVAQKWVINRAKDVAHVLSEKLQSEIKIVLSNGIKNGTAPGEVQSQLEDVLLPYVGSDDIIEDDEVLQPYRLETIVRTNTTQAMNQGRLVAMRDSDVRAFMNGVQYSAILDERTSDICEHLDGQVFKVDDPDLDRLTPPNHFNCRSVLVPIMIDEKIEAGDFINSTDKGKALDLAGKGFV